MSMSARQLHIAGQRIGHGSGSGATVVRYSISLGSENGGLDPPSEFSSGRRPGTRRRVLWAAPGWAAGSRRGGGPVAYSWRSTKATDPGEVGSVWERNRKTSHRSKRTGRLMTGTAYRSNRSSNIHQATRRRIMATPDSEIGLCLAPGSATDKMASDVLTRGSRRDGREIPMRALRPSCLPGRWRSGSA